MKRIILIALLSIYQFALSQDKGTVKGKVTDKEMGGEGLPFANVFIKGTTIGTTTDMDGNYTMAVPVGSQTIVFSFVGYQTVEKPVTVKAGEAVTINQEIGASEGVALEEVEVKAAVTKEKESALLLEQKKAVTIDQKIGKQELSRKGVSDVATAVTKTTGISKQEGSGGGVFVRGLGDRYNVTTLNGFPLPSNDPSKKNIDLSIFGTDIIQFISIDKTYNAKNYGDFGGANIDIVSKDYRKSIGYAELSAGVGLNSQAIKKRHNFYLTSEGNPFGFYSSKYPEFPINNYNFTTSWDRKQKYAPVNSSLSMKGGKAFNINDDTKLGFFIVGSFDNGFSYKTTPSKGNVDINSLARKDLNRDAYSYKTSSTLMGNFNLRFSDHSIKYNGLFINSSNESYDLYEGIYDAFDNASEGGAVIQRQTFQRNQLYVHQILGDLKLKENINVKMGGAYNFNRNTVPDRKQSTVLPVNDSKPNGPKSLNLVSNDSDNHRYYSNLKDEEISANASLDFKFNQNEDEDYNSKLTIGYSGRFKNVIFDAIQFNFKPDFIGQNKQPIIGNVYNLDSYFNQESFDKRLFEIKTFRGGLETTSQDVLYPQLYTGKQNIHGGYVSFTHKFSKKFTTIVGVRAEKILQSLFYDTSVKKGETDLDETQVLPFISMKYELNDMQNLKFAFSKTYTLPQYKERAPFRFEDVVNTTIGNQNLYSSQNYNADLKWEFFPEREELISATLFGKYIIDPINEIGINSASNDISYANTGDWGYVVGTEVELRKKLFYKEEEVGETTIEKKLSGGVNATYMLDKHELNPEKIKRETEFTSSPTNTEDGFAGASAFLANADLTYYQDLRNGMNIQATTVFNYFSDRLVAIGTEGRGNMVDAGYGTLDLILKSKVHDNINFGLSLKNILNPTVRRFQEIQNVDITSYKKGVSLKFSVSYKF